MSDRGYLFYRGALPDEDRRRWRAAARLEGLGGEIALLRLALRREVERPEAGANLLRYVEALARLVSAPRNASADDAAWGATLEQIGAEAAEELWPVL